MFALSRPFSKHAVGYKGLNLPITPPPTEEPPCSTWKVGKGFCNMQAFSKLFSNGGRLRHWTKTSHSPAAFCNLAALAELAPLSAWMGVAKAAVALQQTSLREKHEIVIGFCSQPATSVYKQLVPFSQSLYIVRKT